MSCTYDGRNEVDEWRHHTSRKERWCCACGDTIKPGHRYAYHATLFEGVFRGDHYCLRCEALLKHLVEVSTGYNEGPDPYLDCGHEYEEVHGGPPPEHIAALAFWLPGEPIELSEERKTT